MPAVTINCDFTLSEMSPQTITETPLSQSLLTTEASAKCSLTMSVNTTSTTWTKKSETGRVSKWDPLPLPHRKSSGVGACVVNHAIRRVRRG